MDTIRGYNESDVRLVCSILQEIKSINATYRRSLVRAVIDQRYDRDFDEGFISIIKHRKLSKLKKWMDILSEYDY